MAAARRGAGGASAQPRPPSRSLCLSVRVEMRPRAEPPRTPKVRGQAPFDSWAIANSVGVLGNGGLQTVLQALIPEALASPHGGQQPALSYCPDGLRPAGSATRDEPSRLPQGVPHASPVSPLPPGPRAPQRTRSCHLLAETPRWPPSNSGERPQISWRAPGPAWPGPSPPPLSALPRSCERAST